MKQVHCFECKYLDRADKFSYGSPGGMCEKYGAIKRLHKASCDSFEKKEKSETHEGFIIVKVSESNSDGNQIVIGAQPKGRVYATWIRTEKHEYIFGKRFTNLMDALLDFDERLKMLKSNS